jgi:hypothetical protein
LIKDGAGSVGSSGATAGQGSRDIAYSPQKHIFKTWEPCVLQFGTSVTDAIWERVETQGYTQRRYQNFGSQHDRGSRTVGNCSRAIWDSFAADCGIGVWSTHGGTEKLDVLFIFVPKGSTRNPAKEWRASGNGEADVEAYTYVTYNSLPAGEAWVVKVKKPWFQRHWAGLLSKNKAILVQGQC